MCCFMIRFRERQVSTRVVEIRGTYIQSVGPLSILVVLFVSLSVSRYILAPCELIDISIQIINNAIKISIKR